MSATNRGSVREDFDRYETPDYTIRSLLDQHDINYPVLECSAGNGSILKHLNPDLTWGIDIDPAVKPDQVCDYIQTDFKGQYKTIITNPPYNQALEFTKKALDDVLEGGEVIMLLRINFLESLKRQGFWRENPPSHIYVLGKRPSFNGKGTDATGYAWFVWTKGKTSNDVKMYWT